MTTNCGTIEITLDAKRAPKTAASFASLAARASTTASTFHRIAPGFVIQGGDPEGDGTGGPGYSVVEAPPEDLKYTRAWSRWPRRHRAAGTSGSQFFIVTGEDAGLPPDYALVGKVTRARTSSTRSAWCPRTRPRGGRWDPVVIDSVKVEER